MKNRIHSILNIRFSESNQVFDLLLIQFFIGLANSFVNILAFTLFLYTFSIDMLPLAYIIIAVSLLIINLFYEKLEHHFSPLQLLKVIIGISAGVLFVIWLGLFLDNPKIFIFILLIWSTLFYMISGYAFWGLVSLIFNIRESKRVFSVVGAGDIPAKLIGYLAAPLFISLFGTNNLIWLSIISLITGFVVFSRFLKKKNWEKLEEKSLSSKIHDHKPEQKTEIIGFVFKSELIFAISIISLLSYNVFNLVDFTFLAQVKHKYADIADLAIFIAVFFAAGRFIALILKLIFTSRVIEKLGIIYCLFITPLALLIFCFLFFIYGKDSELNIYIFGMMALFAEVLRSTMQEPVFFVLFQPLKEKLRLKGHLISKGYMLAPSLIIVGLSLYFLPQLGFPITILLTVKILLINLVIWALLILYVKKAYLKTLRSSISKGVFSSSDIHIHDQQTINILLNKISAGRKMEIIYALKLLENAEYALIDELLEEQLSNSSNEVKLYALERLDTRQTINTTFLKSLLKDETIELIKEKMVSILCRYDSQYLKELSENISEQEDSIKKVVIISLLNQREFKYLLTAGNEINSLIYSSESRQRELALSIISELKHLQFTDVIENLINDPDQSVKKNAILIACKLNISNLLPYIISLLDSPSSRYLALQGLQQYEDVLFRDIIKLDPAYIQKYLSDLIKVAAKVNGAHSISFLISVLNDPQIRQDKIIHALWIKQFESNASKITNRFKELLTIYLKNAKAKLSNYYEVPEHSEALLIKNSLFNEVKNDLITSLKICFILHQRVEINRLIELLDIEKRDKIFNAMEMLEMVLPKKTAGEINYLLDFILDPAGINKIFMKSDLNELFNRIITKPQMFNSWTEAIAIYSSWKTNQTSVLKNISDVKIETGDLIISETRSYVLSRLK
ncbi:MFS transporter [Daejeonella oryzae]|uniref:MFS transporter n=1 Tax=Daejeonella oryzae TaxID=1122943 RepID=UPI00040B07F4|nr:MFS transporter [Daejeonella oryzae]